MKVSLHCVKVAALLMMATLNSHSQSINTITLTVHANVDAATQAPTYLRRLQALQLGTLYEPLKELLGEAESITRGHAWLSVKQANVCTTYGLFGNGPSKNIERKYPPGIQRSVKISEEQLKTLKGAISARQDYQWTGYYNCASYVSELWQTTTGELIDPVPIGTVYVDTSGKHTALKTNVRLKPLPPAPLGIVQSIIKLAGTEKFVSNEAVVCP